MPVSEAQRLLSAGIPARTAAQDRWVAARFRPEDIISAGTLGEAARLAAAAAGTTPEYRKRFMGLGAQFVALTSVVDPLSGKGFREDAVDLAGVAAFCIDRVARLGLKPELLGNSVSMLKAWARVVGRPWLIDPASAEHAALKLVIKGLTKMYPQQNSTGQKKPLLFVHIEAARRVLATTFPSLHERETLWLQMLVGHQGFMRYGEMEGLRHQDLEFITTMDSNAPSLEHCAGVRIKIVRAKTGTGQTVTLTRRPDHFDAVGLLWDRVRNAIGRSGDLLFTDDNGGAVSKPRFASRLRRLLLAAGVQDPKCYAGHSLRAGGATDAFDSGVPVDVVITQGRWRSNAWMLYRRQTLAMLRHLGGMQPQQALFLAAAPGATGEDPRGAARRAGGPAAPPRPAAQPETAGPAVPQPGTELQMGMSVSVGRSSFVATIVAFEEDDRVRVVHPGGEVEIRMRSDLRPLGGRRPPAPRGPTFAEEFH